MKLPKHDEKFIVYRDYYLSEEPFSSFVVSGVHIELWGDEKVPDAAWFYVIAECVDDVYNYKCLHATQCLEQALNFIEKCLIPYEEPEEKVEEGLIIEGEINDGRGASEERRGSADTFEIKQETDALDKVDNDHGTYAFLRHDLTNAFKSVSVIPAHLGGVSLA